MLKRIYRLLRASMSNAISGLLNRRHHLGSTRTFCHAEQVSVCRPEHKITREEGRRCVRTHKFGKTSRANHGVSFATCEATCVYLGIVPRILVRYYETAETGAHLESQRYAHTRARARWIMSVVSFRVYQLR